MRRDDFLENELRAALAAPAAPVPQRVLEAARAIWTERHPHRRIAATLCFDGRTGLAPTRDGGPAPAFQRLFETSERFVDLWEERGAQGSYLIAQVYDKEGGTALSPDACLILRTDGVILAALSEGTEQHLASVPTGRWSMQFLLSGETLLLEEIEVGS